MMVLGLCWALAHGLREGLQAPAAGQMHGAPEPAPHGHTHPDLDEADLRLHRARGPLPGLAFETEGLAEVHLEPLVGDLAQFDDHGRQDT